MTGFLSRLAERSVPVGPRLAPKGLLSRAPAHGEDHEEEAGKPEEGSVSRLSGPDRKDKEQASRAEKKEEEKKAEKAPLSRAAHEEEKEPAKGKEEDPPAHRAAKKPDEPEKEKGPEAQGKRPGEEEAHALRRSAEAGHEEDEKGGKAHRALRRSEAAAEAKDEHKAGEEEARAIRRDPASPEEHERLPKPEQTRDEKEPNRLTALRRSPSPGLAAPSPGGAPSFEAGIGGFGPLRPPSPAAEAGFQRPTVQIDQLDVIVQEPASAAPAGAIERSRSIRARYLRKL